MPDALRTLLLIHVMPWFAAPPLSAEYGWHWTMGKLNPAEGKVASHYRPLVGAYDSLDPHVVELQVGWMKLAGFDGVLADWYGVEDVYDYAMIHERTKALFAACERAGLKVSVIYEDQSVGNPVKNGIRPESYLVEGAASAGNWLGKEWISRPSWLRLKGKPTLGVFGPQAFKEAEWAAFRKGTGDIHLLGLHQARPGFDGVFDWPLPSQGHDWPKRFGERAAGQKVRMTTAYPRFHDYYEEGGQTGHPDLSDRLGLTYAETLALGLAAKPDAVQVATWNDWQEGTQIEPSVELGMRDLIITQQARRQIDSGFAFTALDLEAPLALYRLRKRTGQPYDEISALIFAGRMAEARAALAAAGG